MTGDSTGERREGSVGRRAFVRRAGGAAGAAGATAVGLGAGEDASAQAQRYEFGGHTLAWRGRSPEGIADTENPTIELDAGTEYEFWFENVDGAPHNIAVQDADGNTLEESETVSEEGATASITFTATPEMTQYICIVHPTTMVADLEVSGTVEDGAADGEDAGGPSVESLALVGALVMAFVSPVLFALFLFSRRGEDGEGEGDLTTR
ncbi:cupredoxin domain-containing protein [Halorussus halobius]|uniref:cupredoxin domain-containing protein n=1 Tax=Halorussus halobius TaxID=1710537 RepID=UPI001092AC31|nr:plastocyanin/azurin family copper-binding protein [Halorussus halobius]